MDNPTGRLQFWNEWDEKSYVATDRSRPFAERLAAMNWIEDAIGEPRTTTAEELERHTAEMVELGEGCPA